MMCVFFSISNKVIGFSFRNLNDQRQSSMRWWWWWSSSSFLSIIIIIIVNFFFFIESNNFRKWIHPESLSSIKVVIVTIMIRMAMMIVLDALLSPFLFLFNLIRNWLIRFDFLAFEDKFGQISSRALNFLLYLV